MRKRYFKTQWNLRSSPASKLVKKKVCNKPKREEQGQKKKVFIHIQQQRQWDRFL